MVVAANQKEIDMTQTQPSVDPGKCPGCGEYFKGERGLRAHQNSKFVTLACRPVRKAGA